MESTRVRPQTAREDCVLRNNNEAAEILGMSPSWLNHDRQAVEPQVPFIRVGRRAVRYRLSDLLAYAEGRKGKRYVPEPK